MEPGKTPLRLHLRLVRCGRTVLRVLSLRPATRVRFSTNYYHDTWHLLSDTAGGAVLARLLWGLAFERRPDTVIAIFGDHLAPTPFEADRASPIVIAPAAVSPLTTDKVGALAKHLRRVGPSHGTVKWQTFGMAAALAEGWPPRHWSAQPWAREDVRHVEGLVCYSAAPEALRVTALAVHRMHAHMWGGTAYTYLAERGERTPLGEVQLLGGFATRLQAATAARAAVLDEPGVGQATQAQKEQIWQEADRVREARRGPR